MGQAKLKLKIKQTTEQVETTEGTDNAKNYKKELQRLKANNVPKFNQSNLAKTIGIVQTDLTKYSR